MNRRVVLLLPPFYTPWTPPLGISLLKAHLERHGHPTTCVDFNTDPSLWATHHEYFATLQRHERITINDGYSKLWHVLDSHLLARLNGADHEACKRLLATIIPVYGMAWDEALLEDLLPIVDRHLARLEQAIAQCTDFSDVAFVGTSTYTTSLASSLFVLRWVKSRFPHIKTVMGGGVFADDLAIGSDNLETLLREYPFVDHVIVGEGEQLLRRLVSGGFAGKRLIRIDDLLLSKTLDMNDVPLPSFTDFDLRNYHHLTIEGARSCPFQCTFCSETIQWGDYRKKSKGLLASQVVELARTYGNNTFFMGDSLMNPYIMDLSKGLLELGANVLYDGYLRADKIAMNRPRVREWARSGLYRVRLGIESASRNVLEIMDKMTSPEVISEVLKSLSAAGIRTTTYWIAGHPGETASDFEETLDFVREHRDYIYELEAHPFYHHPYGQVASRRYQSRSLYPDEVTRIIKFQTWDIVGCSPDRQERYERLRRMAEVASECGLVNIYSMAERYQAEARWLALHPLAREIYKGTHANVRRPSPTASLARLKAALPAPRANEGALVYRIDIQGKLDPQKLAEALEALIAHDDTLRASGAGGPATDLFSVHEAPPGDAEPAVRALARGLSAQVEAQAEAPVRVGFVAGEDGGALLLAARRGVADGASVAMLAEELFRLHAQLSEGLPPALPRLSAAPDVLAGAFGGLAFDAARPPAGPLGAAASLRATMPAEQIEQALTAGARAWGATPLEVSLVVLARCAEGWAEGPVVVAAQEDLRVRDPRLVGTLGPLVRWSSLALSGLQDGAERATAQVLENVRRLRAAEPAPEAAGAFLALALEHLGKLPFLDDERFHPAGVVVDEDAPIEARSVLVTPVRRRGDVEIVIRHGSEARALAARVAERLPAVLAAIVEEAGACVAAKELWERARDSKAGAVVAEIATGPAAPGSVRSGLVALSVQVRVAPQLAGSTGISPASAALAACVTLLVRLCGAEELLFAYGRRACLPLAVRVGWTQSFRALALHAGAQLAERTALAARLPDGEPPRDARLPELAFALRVPGELGEGSAWASGVELGFEVTETPEMLEIAIWYRPDRFDAARMELLGRHLGRTLDAGLANPDVAVGDMELEEARPARVGGALAALEGDQFAF